MADYINIPINAKKKYQRNRQQKELFVFAVLLKCRYGNSAMHNVTIKKAQEVCSIGFSKAKRIFAAAREDGNLFSYNGERLTSKSLKSAEVKYNRKGQAYHSDYCQKVVIKKYTFKELYTLIYTEGNVLGIISAQERKSISTVGTKGVELTQRNIANATGLSRGYISKLTKKLAEKDLISKDGAKIKLAMNVVNKETIAEFQKETGRKNFILNPHDGSGWIVVPCRYSIKDRGITECFKHVIYDQWNRTGSHARVGKGNNQFTGLGGAYE